MANLASLTSFKEGDRRKVIHQGSRFEHWKRLFLGGFNSMFVLNLVGLLGLLPICLVGYSYFSTVWSTASVLPFASSVGTGILTVVDTASIKHITDQASFVLNMMLLMPAAIVASAVLSSPFFYAMRNAEYDGVVSGYSKSIIGFKYCGVKFGILGVIAAILFEICAVGYYFYAEYAFSTNNSVVSYAMLVGVGIFAALSIITMIYAFIMTVTYKMSVMGAMKRALRFTFTLPLQNICILIFTLAPLTGMLFGSFAVSMVVTLYIFVGLSYMLSIWMVYVQTVLTAATPQSAMKAKK